jgi:FKBP-type peptidyl-prolyl cis-trans isomerase SlyD
MNISKNKVVSLSYELRLDNKDGEIVEVVNADRPLTFLYGAGNLLPEFEKNIDNLNPGASFSFLLTSDNAYGPAMEDAVVEVPLQTFMVNGEIDNDLLVEGNAIPMSDAQGNRLNGIVVEVKSDVVIMDFNHPLAGDDLFFSGSVVDVRDATPEELAAGYVQGAGCSSGGCGGCGGDCH